MKAICFFSCCQKTGGVLISNYRGAPNTETVVHTCATASENIVITLNMIQNGPKIAKIVHTIHENRQYTTQRTGNLAVHFAHIQGV